MGLELQEGDIALEPVLDVSIRIVQVKEGGGASNRFHA